MHILRSISASFRQQNILSAFPKKPNVLILSVLVLSFLHMAHMHAFIFIFFRKGHTHTHTYISMQQCINSPKKTKEHMQSKKQLAHLHVLVGMIRYAYVQIRRALLCISRTICRRPTCPAIPRVSDIWRVCSFPREPDRHTVSYRKRCRSCHCCHGVVSEETDERALLSVLFSLRKPQKAKESSQWLCRCFPVFVQLSSAFRSFTLLAAGRQAR